MNITKAKIFAEKLKMVKEIGKVEDLDDLAQKVSVKIEELGKALREEIEETNKAQREEMQKNKIEMEKQFALERKHMKETAIWRWVITTAIVVAAIIKEIYF